jgi:hypothetical protein
MLITVSGDLHPRKIPELPVLVIGDKNRSHRNVTGWWQDPADRKDQ